ncbi:MAG: ABC transporter substrate-binding protein [Desulfobacterales bacterium]|nr:ABC transporter substrate-binding protein [Desulfobacterales bacterium]
MSIIAMMFFAFLATGCQSPDESAAPKTGSPGVTAQEVVLGSSLALKGHASFLGTQTFRGAMCYLNHVNELGGVHGRTIKLVAYDDSYDPPMCLAEHPEAHHRRSGVRPVLLRGHPHDGQGPAASSRKPASRCWACSPAPTPCASRSTAILINVRASYYQETGAAVRHLVDDLGLRKIAVFYQYDAYGFDGLTGTELALEALQPGAGRRGLLQPRHAGRAGRPQQDHGLRGRGRGDDRDLRSVRQVHPAGPRTGIPARVLPGVLRRAPTSWPGGLKTSRASRSSCPRWSRPRPPRPQLRC